MSSVASVYAHDMKQDNGSVQNVMQLSELMTSIKFIYLNHHTIDHYDNILNSLHIT